MEIYIVKRMTSSKNDWMDYGQVDYREDIVGTFSTIEQARETVELVNSWPRREEGCDVEKDNDGNIMSSTTWGCYHCDCSIETVTFGKLLIEPPVEKFVLQAIASEKAEAERMASYG